MKKIRRDKPIGIIIHIYMKIPQANSLCGYLYPPKCHVFHFLFSLFSPTKSVNRKAESPRVGGARVCGGVEERG
jgi:hypothetical protein